MPPVCFSVPPLRPYIPPSTPASSRPLCVVWVVHPYLCDPSAPLFTPVYPLAAHSGCSRSSTCQLLPTSEYLYLDVLTSVVFLSRRSLPALWSASPHRPMTHDVYDSGIFTVAVHRPSLSTIRLKFVTSRTKSPLFVMMKPGKLTSGTTWSPSTWWRQAEPVSHRYVADRLGWFRRAFYYSIQTRYMLPYFRRSEKAGKVTPVLLKDDILAYSITKRMTNTSADFPDLLWEDCSPNNRFKLHLYYNSLYGHCLSLTSVCGAYYFWSLQTEFWADRFAKCLKMFHLTYFLYYKVLAL